MTSLVQQTIAPGIRRTGFRLRCPVLQFYLNAGNPFLSLLPKPACSLLWNPDSVGFIVFVMCTREEFVKVFDKLLNIEIEDMKQNYALPETAIHWIEKVFMSKLYSKC